MVKKIEIYKRFFTISVAAFEMQHTLSKAFGYKGDKSYMHTLHLEAQEEINQKKPDLEKIDNLIMAMEENAGKN
jgi:hypothetical protein